MIYIFMVSKILCSIWNSMKYEAIFVKVVEKSCDIDLQGGKPSLSITFFQRLFYYFAFIYK